MGLAEHLGEATFDIFPSKQIDTIINRLEDANLPLGTRLTIANHDFNEAYELVEKLPKKYFLITHLQARDTRKEDLEGLLEKLWREGIEEIFVIGGDIDIPVKGGYTSALEMIKDIRELEGKLQPNHRFKIGVAGYPGGHPHFKDKESVLDDLRQKAGYADFLVTQFCTDTRKIIEYLKWIREKIPVYEVRLGIPSNYDLDVLKKDAVQFRAQENLAYLNKDRSTAYLLISDYLTSIMAKIPILRNYTYLFPFFSREKFFRDIIPHAGRLYNSVNIFTKNQPFKALELLKQYKFY